MDKTKPRQALNTLITNSSQILVFVKVKGKGKAVPLQAWSGPEGSKKLRFPDFTG